MVKSPLAARVLFSLIIGNTLAVSRGREQSHGDFRGLKAPP